MLSANLIDGQLPLLKLNAINTVSRTSRFFAIGIKAVANGSLIIGIPQKQRGKRKVMLVEYTQTKGRGTGKAY